MNLEIQRREREGIVILDLKGRLLLGPEDLAFRKYLLDLLDSGVRNAILNFSEVTHIDTAGFGTIVLCAEKYHQAGGKLALLNPRPSQTRFADVLKIESALETYDDEQAAVNAFFPDRAVAHYDILEFVEELEERKRSGGAEHKPA